MPRARFGARGRPGPHDQYTYDAMDRLIQTNYPDGTTANATYNWRGIR